MTSRTTEGIFWNGEEWDRVEQLVDVLLHRIQAPESGGCHSDCQGRVREGRLALAGTRHSSSQSDELDRHHRLRRIRSERANGHQPGHWRSPLQILSAPAVAGSAANKR